MYISQFKTTATFSAITLNNILAPTTGNYLLNFDMGSANSGTSFSFDDVLLCQQDAWVVPESVKVEGVLRADTSTSFEEGSPTLFKPQIMTPFADASVILQQTGAAAKSGATGAAITVNKAGSYPWHVQLAGPAVRLQASKSYTVQLAMKQVVPLGADASHQRNVVTVNWIQPEVYTATAVGAIQPTGSYEVHTLRPVSPPQDGLFYLTVDMGTLAAGTTLFVDDLIVYEASQ
jgi:hypothetical protein